MGSNLLAQAPFLQLAAGRCYFEVVPHAELVPQVHAQGHQGYRGGRQGHQEYQGGRQLGLPEFSR